MIKRIKQKALSSLKENKLINTKIKRIKSQERKRREQNLSKPNNVYPDKKITDKWKIVKDKKHPKHSLVVKAITHDFEKSYAQVRAESGVGKHYNRNGSQNKHFFRAAMFCHEHNVDPLVFVRFAAQEYAWLKTFPSPPNIAGDWIMNLWTSKGGNGSGKKTLGGRNYKQASPELIGRLKEAGFTTVPYTSSECRFIESTAKDLAQFGNVDTVGMVFEEEIRWLAKNMKG